MTKYAHVQGFVEPGFGKIAEAFERNFTDHGELGAGFALYVDGLQEQEVAVRLEIAESTVEEHLKRIRRKYALVERPARTKLELYKRAIEDGIIPPVLPLA